MRSIATYALIQSLSFAGNEWGPSQPDQGGRA
jgi:hypothetical protein